MSATSGPSTIAVTGSDGCIGAGDLRRRGWTETAIHRFLGEPDKTVRNPVHRSGPMMRLYRVERVEAVEESAEWQAMRDKATRRAPRGARVG